MILLPQPPRILWLQLCHFTQLNVSPQFDIQGMRPTTSRGRSNRKMTQGKRTEIAPAHLSPQWPSWLQGSELEEPVPFLPWFFLGSGWFKYNSTFGSVGLSSSYLNPEGNWSKSNCLLKKKSQGWGSLGCGVRIVLEKEGHSPSKHCCGKASSWTGFLPVSLGKGEIHS